MPEIQLKRLARSMAEIPIEGTAPLIQNRFAEKAKQMMLDRQQGNAVEREPKNPDALFADAQYRLPGDRYGHPAVAFKSALVGGARFYKGSKITMTGLKVSLFVRGEGSDMLVEIDGVPKMREDPVRNSNGVADLRYRPVYWPWTAKLQVVYIRSQFSLDSLVALVDAGGNIGVGEWRPEYGTFKVPDDAEAQEVQL
ncbi:MAG TPA: hypothetical protein VGH66_03245 [Acidimicrobiales bacterium]